MKKLPTDHLPNRIREIRQSKKWNLAFLAEKLGCTEPWLSDIETGKKALKQSSMDAIANALGVFASDLLPARQSRSALSIEEMRLLENFRRTPEAQKAAITGVAENLGGYSAEPADLGGPKAA